VLLRRSRVLQVLLLITVAGNLALGGLSEVAMPALSHQRFGASGYGALLACLAAGSIAGSLAATRSGGLRRPALAASGVFAAESVAISLVPFLGGLPGAAVAMAIVGAGNGLGNAIMIPRLQAWAPPELLGRVMGLLMLSAFGSFPVSVALTGLFVRHLGAPAFFPVTGAFGMVVFLGALTFRDWRDFGTTQVSTSAASTAAGTAQLPSEAEQSSTLRVVRIPCHCDASTVLASPRHFPVSTYFPSTATPANGSPTKSISFRVGVR
jgi:hypothetical protein